MSHGLRRQGRGPSNPGDPGDPGGAVPGVTLQALAALAVFVLLSCLWLGPAVAQSQTPIDDPASDQINDLPPDFGGEDLTWFELAAEAGSLEAMYRLGTFNELGLRTPQNLDLAEYWYRRAAEMGHLEATLRLADLLTRQGETTAALRWYERAAALGEVTATYNLGLIYRDGLGVAPERDKAVSYLKQAAQMGLAQAEGDLALLLLQSAVTPVQRVEALAWLTLAARDGVAGAYQLLAGQLERESRETRSLIQALSRSLLP